MPNISWLVTRFREPGRSFRLLAQGLRHPKSMVMCYRALTKYSANQDPFELLELIKLVKTRRLATVLEIGTFLGGTLNIWCKLAEANATIISVNLPAPKNEEETVKRLLSLKRGNQNLVLIRDSSRSEQSLRSVQDALGSKMLDLLFIDGDHSYAGVKHDYETYGRFVKEGGLIVFHDINPQADDATAGVARLWKEIRDHGRTREFFGRHPRLRKGLGIGVLEKNSVAIHGHSFGLSSQRAQLP